MSPQLRQARHGNYRAGFAFGVLSFLATMAVGLVSAVLSARLYGVRVIGAFALVSAPVGALAVLSSVKEQQALIREITRLKPREPRVTQLFAAVFTFSFTLTLAVASIGVLACWFVFRGPLHAPRLFLPAAVSLAGSTLITNTGWNIDSIFAAFVAGRQLFAVRLHEVLSFIAIAVLASVALHSVWALVIATVGGSFTALLHRAIAVRPFVRARLSWSEYREGMRVLPDLLRFGLKATPGQVAQGASQQGGVWVLGALTSTAVVGAYSRAQVLPQRLQQASMRVTEVLYPTLVHRHAKGDGSGFDRALVDSIRYEMVGMLLIAAAIGGAAHAVLAVFGPGFGRAAPALALLMVYPAFASVTVTQTQALWATDQPGRTSVIAIVRLLVTVALLALLTPRMGIVGPAVALLAGFVVVIALSGMALRRSMSASLRNTWPLRERLALAAAYAAGFLAANRVEHAVPSIAGLAPSLLAGVLAYVAVLILGGAVNERDRGRIADLANLMRARRRASAAQAPVVAQPEGVTVAATEGAIAD